MRCESFPLRSGSHWHRGRSYNSTGGTGALGHRGCYAESSLHCSLSWYHSLGLHCSSRPGRGQHWPSLCSLPWWCGYFMGGSCGHQPLPSGCLDFWGLGMCYAINPSIASPPYTGKMQFSFDMVLWDGGGKDTFSSDLTGMFYPSKCLSQKFWLIWHWASAMCLLLC